MPIQKPKQFETTEQIGQTLAELDCQLADAFGAVQRLGRLRDRLAGEVAAMEREIEQIELFTDADIAKIVGDVTPATIARQRQAQNWPHVLIGNKPRYTRRQIETIFEIVGINKGTAAGLRQRAA